MLRGYSTWMSIKIVLFPYEVLQCQKISSSTLDLHYGRRDYVLFNLISIKTFKAIEKA